jgi:hypothetical protein
MIETLELLKEVTENLNLPLKRHLEIQDDLNKITVIIEEWEKAKEIKVEEQK